MKMKYTPFWLHSKAAEVVFEDLSSLSEVDLALNRRLI